MLVFEISNAHAALVQITIGDMIYRIQCFINKIM